MKRLALVTVSTLLALTQTAFAQQQGHGNHRAEKRAFKLGVCVGQNLAAAGIDVSTIDKSSVDDTTKAAFKTAMEACRSSSGSGATSSSAGSSSSSDATPSATLPASSSSSSDGTSATN